MEIWMSMEIQKAAKLLSDHWLAGTKISALPDDCRPRNEAQGSQVQTALGDCLEDATVGWKIAATGKAGQQHIHVDGPMAGRLFASRVKHDGARIPMDGNRMLVAECEFVFVLGQDLPPRDTAYSQTEVLAAVASLHPGLELPDSRFEDFTTAGAAQLLADNACAHYFVLGQACGENWRELDLVTHATCLHLNGKPATHGSGADVLGDPRTALTWVANNHALRGEGLKAGQMITTGVAGKPVAVKAGDLMCADLGTLGSVSATLVA